VWSNRPGSRLSIPRIVIPALRELVATRKHVRAVAQRPVRAGDESPAAVG
jgi:hypothetical protein